MSQTKTEESTEESQAFRTSDGLDGMREAPTGNPLVKADDHGRDQSPARPRGRLIFALDATASRAETWATARKVQAKMFREAAPLGKLDVQLIYYRGAGERSNGERRGWRECKASKWVSSGEQLAQLMDRIDCWCGGTQIGRVLAHALNEVERAPLQALVFIGDCFEEEIGEIGALAGELGARDVPIFVYHEGRDPIAMKAFRLMALKSGGQYFVFNPQTSRAVEQLAEQLGAVARLAMGDTEALEKLAGTAALTDQRASS
jgi:hypothetical protein